MSGFKQLLENLNKEFLDENDSSEKECQCDKCDHCVKKNVDAWSKFWETDIPRAVDMEENDGVKVIKIRNIKDVRTICHQRQVDVNSLIEQSKKIYYQARNNHVSQILHAYFNFLATVDDNCDLHFDKCKNSAYKLTLHNEIYKIHGTLDQFFEEYFPDLKVDIKLSSVIVYFT